MLLQWCTYFNKSIHEFTHTIYHDLSNDEHGDMYVLDEIYDELNTHIIPQSHHTTTSPASTLLNTPPSPHESYPHADSAYPHSVHKMAPTTLNGATPDHIRALFDRCAFNEYTFPPFAPSSNSSTPHNDAPLNTRSTSNNHQSNRNNLTLSHSLPSNNDSHQSSVPNTIHYRHYYPLNNDHTYTPSINDLDMPHYDPENKINLQELFSSHNSSNYVLGNTVGHHSSTDDAPDNGCDNHYYDNYIDDD